MCTLTWWNGQDGYEVFFNRDERLTRAEALPPVVDSWNGVRFVAPVDRPSGGTWLLANEYGLTLAILNLYEHELLDVPGEILRSRGLLLRGLASCTRLEDVGDRLHAEGVSECNAFTLIGFDTGPSGADFRVWRWRHDRERLVGPEDAPEMPVCSSSYDPERVIASRRKIFGDFRKTIGGEADPKLLARYHRYDREGQASADTVLMRRSDARTLSISRVTVGKRWIRFGYEVVPPEGPLLGQVEVCELARR